MGIVWAGALVTATLLVLVLWAIWWIVSSGRKQKRQERAANQFAEKYDVEPGMGLGRMGRHRRPGHLLRGIDDSLTVDELVEEAKAKGRPVRLNWSEGDERLAGDQRPMKPGVDKDEWPTGILPRVPKDPE